MVSIISKMKSQIGMWRISRYTKRRTYVTIEGDQQEYHPYDDAVVDEKKEIKAGGGKMTRATRYYNYSNSNNNNNNNRDAAHLLTTSMLNNESEINHRASRSNYSESYSMTAAAL